MQISCTSQKMSSTSSNIFQWVSAYNRLEQSEERNSLIHFLDDNGMVSLEWFSTLNSEQIESLTNSSVAQRFQVSLRTLINPSFAEVNWESASICLIVALDFCRLHFYIISEAEQIQLCENETMVNLFKHLRDHEPIIDAKKRNQLRNATASLGLTHQQKKVINNAPTFQEALEKLKKGGIPYDLSTAVGFSDDAYIGQVLHILKSIYFKLRRNTITSANRINSIQELVRSFPELLDMLPAFLQVGLRVRRSSLPQDVHTIHQMELLPDIGALYPIASDFIRSQLQIPMRGEEDEEKDEEERREEINEEEEGKVRVEDEEKEEGDISDILAMLSLGKNSEEERK